MAKAIRLRTSITVKAPPRVKSAFKQEVKQNAAIVKGLKRGDIMFVERSETVHNGEFTHQRITLKLIPKE